MIKLFTLRFSEKIDGFDDEQVRGFMADKTVIAIENWFFMKHNIPYLTIMLTYEPTPAAGDSRSPVGDQNAKQEDYRKHLTDESIPLFNLIRDWRNERALKDAVPKYVVMTNKQLAEIAVKAPDTLSGLSAIDGIGKVKLKRYGRDILR